MLRQRTIRRKKAYWQHTERLGSEVISHLKTRLERITHLRRPTTIPHATGIAPNNTPFLESEAMEKVSQLVTNLGEDDQKLTKKAEEMVRECFRHNSLQADLPTYFGRPDSPLLSTPTGQLAPSIWELARRLVRFS